MNQDKEVKKILCSDCCEILCNNCNYGHKYIYSSLTLLEEESINLQKYDDKFDIITYPEVNMDFEDEHGYPVICQSCFDDLPENEESDLLYTHGVQLAIEKEL